MSIRHRLGAAGVACTAPATRSCRRASASELIARNATNVRVQADAQGRALVSFRSEGQSRQLLAWGAIDARPPSQITATRSPVQRLHATTADSMPAVAQADAWRIPLRRA